MTKLWELLTLELGSAFCRQFGNAGGVTYKHWSKELAEFSEVQLVQALERFKLSKSTYMSLNIFRNHCIPPAEDLGLQEFDTAYQAVIFGKWEQIHPVFQRLCQEHRYTLRQKSDSEARKTFRSLYNDAIKRVSRGEKFERIQAIEHEPNPTGVKVFGRDQGKKTIKDLLSMMGSNKANA